MTDLAHLVQSGSGHLWLYLPMAVFLGALHGLEPGHSKTMMAAFIIAVRGTIPQAVLLGLSAAISHSLIIWLLAALALTYGSQWNAETVEPWLQVISGTLVLMVAAWMFARTWREVREARAHHHAAAATAKPAMQAAGMHDIAVPEGLLAPARFAARKSRGPHGGMLLDTGHGWLEIAVFDEGGPPRFRIHPCQAGGAPAPLPRHTRMSIETTRIDGSTQIFQFEPAGTFWEATAVLPEPREFAATVTMSHEGHAHSYKLRFAPDQALAEALVEEIKDPDSEIYQDAHERYHAEDIAKRFASRNVTTPQIVLFGITGGLTPCPAAFTILLLCLQLKKVSLGFTLVAAFSFGLAITMVTVGAVAAWSVRHATKRFSGFGEAMRKAPFVSCALLAVLALYMLYSGWHTLTHMH